MGVERMSAKGIVPAGQRLATTITPALNKKITLTAFMGKASFSKNSYTAVIFNYGAADPADEIFMAIEKGSGEKHDEDIQEVTGDGAKKLAIVCSNAEPTDELVMDAYATVQVED